MVLRPHSGKQVHQEREDVEGKDESEDPFKDGSSIEITLSVADTKSFKNVIRRLA